jgi:hypothetical protein
LNAPRTRGWLSVRPPLLLALEGELTRPERLLAQVGDSKSLGDVGPLAAAERVRAVASDLMRETSLNREPLAAVERSNNPTGQVFFVRVGVESPLLSSAQKAASGLFRVAEARIARGDGGESFVHVATADSVFEVHPALFNWVVVWRSGKWADFCALIATLADAREEAPLRAAPSHDRSESQPAVKRPRRLDVYVRTEGKGGGSEAMRVGWALRSVRTSVKVLGSWIGKCNGDGVCLSDAVVPFMRSILRFVAASVATNYPPLIAASGGFIATMDGLRETTALTNADIFKMFSLIVEATADEEVVGQELSEATLRELNLRMGNAIVQLVRLLPTENPHSDDVATLAAHRAEILSEWGGGEDAFEKQRLVEAMLSDEAVRAHAVKLFFTALLLRQNTTGNAPRALLAWVGGFLSAAEKAILDPSALRAADSLMFAAQK